MQVGAGLRFQDLLQRWTAWLLDFSFIGLFMW